VLPAAQKLHDELHQTVRVKLDDRTEQTAPWKFNEWEMRGVPLRIEIGPRDVASGNITIARRDTLEKSVVPMAEAGSRVAALLTEVQGSLLDRAREYLKQHTLEANDRATFIAALQRQDGFVLAPWCERAECEAQIKAETSAVTRVIAGPAAAGSICVNCGQPARVKAYFARSY
jgi:prolyl-tRNA synthetase